LSVIFLITVRIENTPTGHLTACGTIVMAGKIWIKIHYEEEKMKTNSTVAALPKERSRVMGGVSHPQRGTYLRRAVEKAKEMNAAVQAIIRQTCRIASQNSLPIAGPE